MAELKPAEPTSYRVIISTIMLITGINYCKPDKAFDVSLDEREVRWILKKNWARTQLRFKSRTM